MTPPCSGSTTSNGTSATSERALDKDEEFLYAPLTCDELEQVRDTIKHHLLDEHDISDARFSYITLHEQSTTREQRIAEAVVHLPPSTPHLIRVRLASNCTTNNTCITSDHELPCDVQPVLTPDDCELAEKIALESKQLKHELCNAYGEEFDMRNLVCDPWSVHMAERKIEEEKEDEEFDCFYDSKRLVQLFLYYKLKKSDDDHVENDEWNHYSHPLHLVPMVDLVEKKVVNIHGVNRDKSSIPKIPSSIVNYHDTTKTYNTNNPVKENTKLLKPIQVKQPEGPSFTLNGTELKWYHWKMNVTYNYREGVVLHNIKYMNRSIVKRMSLVEMAVPYGDRNEPFQRKCAFDIGDYGLGYCIQSLKLGCDCLGNIQYIPVILSDSNGSPYVVDNGVCIHEEDNGILYKHVEYRTNKSFVRRNRKLIISFISTVVNYEYLFYFYFNLDGTFGLDIKLSGMLSTNLLSENEVNQNNNLPLHGTLVSDNVNAQIHQHMFCARIQPSVDGNLNRVHELSVNPAKDEEYGNEFSLSEELIENEQMSKRDLSIGTFWRISNHTVPSNKISKKPVAYKLIVPPNPSLLTSANCMVSKRAAFAKHTLWVTKYNPIENFPAGEFPTQSKGVSGIDKWIQNRNHSLVDSNLVLWCSFGLLHMPRVEDFPIMPCESTGFYFKPDGFFESSPTLDLPPDSKSESVCCDVPAN